MPNEKSNFKVYGGGTIYELVPLDEQAKDWIKENIGENNGYQPYYPERVIVEHRYIEDIVNGIRADGLTVS